MFLNKSALFAILTALVTSGCVNTQVEEQQTQITNLENELVLAQTTNQQTQLELVAVNTELAAVNTELTTSSNQVATLSAQLADKSKTPKVETLPVVVTKESTKFNNKSILGQGEWVYVSAAKSNFKSRIDTGATTSSINAVDIERFERDGKKWVRFNLAHSENDQKELIEAKIVRIAKIVQSSNPGQEAERLVVSLHVRIGDVVQKTEFTLADLVHMEYPILIGRTFLQDVALVDVSQEYIYPKYQAKK